MPISVAAPAVEPLSQALLGLLAFWLAQAIAYPSRLLCISTSLNARTATSRLQSALTDHGAFFTFFHGKVPRLTVWLPLLPQSTHTHTLSLITNFLCDWLHHLLHRTGLASVVESRTFSGRCSEASDVNRQVYGSSVPVLEGEKLSLRILVS